MGIERIMQYECKVCGRKIDVTRTGDIYEEPVYCCGLEATESSELFAPQAAPAVKKKPAKKKPAKKKAVKKAVKKAAKKKAAKKGSEKKAAKKKVAKKKAAKKKAARKKTQERRPRKEDNKQSPFVSTGPRRQRFRGPVLFPPAPENALHKTVDLSVSRL